MSLGENKLDMQDFPIEIQNMILQHMEGLHNQAIVDEQRYQIFFQKLATKNKPLGLTKKQKHKQGFFLYEKQISL